VLDADTIRRVDTRYGAVVLRGALRRAIRAGIIRPLPLKILALMLTGAILEGCMAIADSDDPTRAREDAGNVLTTLLEGLRPHTPANVDEAPRQSNTPHIETRVVTEKH
jgi:hypothetical protein